jgi:hypothetical protein
MATKTKSTLTSKSASKAVPAPKPTPAKAAATVKAGTSKTAPKPAAKQNPAAVSKPNGVQTFFRNDESYFTVLRTVKEGFLASTGANKAGKDLIEKTVRMYHIHKITAGVLCSVAARGPKGFSPTQRYLKAIVSGKSPAALLKFKELNYPHRVLHLCEACIHDLKVG